MRLGGYTFVSLDDIHQRALAQEDPVFFLNQFTGKILLDEATLVPALFPELKRRADAFKAARLQGKKVSPFDVWITGSNQTLLQKSVRESLAGRASYFDLNTLSLHEMPKAPLADFFMKGGWPELHANTQLDAKRYLDDLISTFIEKDIVVAAGIERKAAFLKATALAAGRVGQLFNASDIARNTGVESTTIQSWMQILQDNGIVRLLQPYFNNRSQRFIKTPKIYFQDTGLATRLQGWSEYTPLLVSPAFGHLFENLVLNEIERFFINRGERAPVFFLRSKEHAEVDFLVELGNARYLAIEVKRSPGTLEAEQRRLLEKTGLDIVDTWVVGDVERMEKRQGVRIVPLRSLWRELNTLYKNSSTRRTGH
ncbi:MAG: hypothetical protein LDLANPLL_00012 [Turneriella sp.]|nr:hypothetical protein [Turneriella sp.]